VLVVAKAEPEALGKRLVERPLAGMAEGRMAEIVAEPDRLGQVSFNPSARATPREIPVVSSVCVSRVRSGRLGVYEHLCLVREPAKGLGVDDAVAVALKGRPEAARPLGLRPPFVSYERTASGDSERFSSSLIRLRRSRQSSRRDRAS